MRCPYPVNLRNPALDSPLWWSIDGITYVGPGGEIQPGRIEVPCGKCVVCQENRRNEWSARMELESRMSKVTYFITLTYDPEHCPSGLRLSDLQKFFKRLRHRVSCRFFACGEYGDQFQRPHYHSIVWLDKFVSSTDFDRIIQDSWGAGFVQVREADRNAFRYVAKYTLKSYKASPIGEPEPFAVMSRRPGIAKPWIDEVAGKYFNEYILLNNGIRQALPRYNLSKLDPVEQIRIKDHRREHASARLDKSVELLRAVNLERSLIRKFNNKYGK